MIASLDDAWRWYEGVRESALVLRALGRKHWDTLDWVGPLGRDERLRVLQSEELSSWSDHTLAELDDLCVLVLFSVFEAAVRDRTSEDVQAELPVARHPALAAALKELHRTIEQGSFFRVLDACKAVDADLVEQVSQVRKYRNWVAHGRRGKSEVAVTPAETYDRLRRFLAAVYATGG